MVSHMNRLETAARLAMADFSEGAPTRTSTLAGVSQLNKAAIALCLVAATGLLVGGIL